MIDYWEALGRLAFDAELTEGFLRVLPPAGLFPLVTATRDEHQCTGVDIPGKFYDDVQRYLEPVLTEHYLSLTGAGELIWAFSYENVREFARALNKIVAKARPRLSSPSTAYFISLGLVTADGRFRHKVMKSDSRSLDRFRRMSDPEVKNLLGVMENQDFESKIGVFSSLWPLGCIDDYVFYEGHLHPFAVNAPNGEHYKSEGGGY